MVITQILHGNERNTHAHTNTSINKHFQYILINIQACENVMFNTYIPLGINIASYSTIIRK